MVVELRMAANRRFGLELPLATLADGASISSIATKLVRRLRAGQPIQIAVRTVDLDLAAKHVGDSLGESEVERLKQAIDRQAGKNEQVSP
jgi:phthiocerol/phenolphthiocerol synthesis type-I polyketide synthase C